MDRFDEKIIGYESTKNILRQILDALKRPELYKSKGASIPRGLLMESDPGLGKSLLATVFIKESGRRSYVFRKTSQENSFLDELRAAFSAAKEAAPSILLLEDLNLYVESNSPYAPEWACLQACIDDAKSTDHNGCDFARDAPALIIMPDIVSVQAVRDSISLDADAGE